ncbi:MAG: radical SAM protein [Pseudomonadota bacterium]
MPVKVLFIFSVEVGSSIEKPLVNHKATHEGISIISAVLKRHSHKTRLLVLGRNRADANWSLIRKTVEEFQPGVIAFTSVATAFPYIATVAKKIRSKYPNPYLLIGGPHVSLNPQQAIDAGFDAVCIGEGEFPTLELVTQLDQGESPSGIPNLWIRKSNTLEKNPTRSFVQDLDSLPFSDREIWEEWTAAPPKATVTVTLARGCPFVCSYCSNHALSRLATGKYVRFRSPASIIDEIRALLKRYPKVRRFHLEAETVGVRPKWALELCTSLNELNDTLSSPLSFGCNLRITPKLNADELFAAFVKANITHVDIGLESGSERVRNEILRRHYSNEDVMRAVESARNYGISVAFFNMIGLPGETYEDFLETVRVNRACNPDSHFTSIFYPYPGTDLHKLCEDQGLLGGKLDPEKERRVAQLDLPTFSAKKIQKSFNWFEYSVYRGQKPLFEIMKTLFWVRVESSPFLGAVKEHVRQINILTKLKKKLVTK